MMQRLPGPPNYSLAWMERSDMKGLKITACPCNSGKKYKNCCQLVHDNPKSAEKPEQLMRARYSAYVLGLVYFLVDTFHPDCHANEDREEIAASCQLNWIKLAIKQATLISESQGYVHFKAFYLEHGQSYCLEERSRFLRIDGQWFYVDGEFL